MVILVVLAVVLVTSVRRIYENSTSITCLANLRQYKMAMDLYANDHDDELPPDGNGDANPTWYQAIERWNKEILPVYKLQCQANPDLDTINSTQENIYQRFTYSYNAYLGTLQFGRSKNTIKRAHVRNQREFPLFIEGKMHPVGRLVYHWSPGAGFDDRVGFWHNNHTRILFLDGHVEPYENSSEDKQIITDMYARLWIEYARPYP